MNGLKLLERFLKKVWWTWGICLVIAFFSWGLLHEVVCKPDDPLGQYLSFFAPILVSYFLGAAWRDFWSSKIS